MHPVPHAAITFNSETLLFGFSVWFPGRRPHYVMDTFRSAEAARLWIDPLDEREWVDTPQDGGAVIATSTGFKAGSAPTRA